MQGSRPSSGFCSCGWGRLYEPYRVKSFFASKALCGVIALLLLAPAVFGHPDGGPVWRLLAVQPLAWLGLVSYGFFLWHLRCS